MAHTHRKGPAFGKRAGRQVANDCDRGRGWKYYRDFKISDDGRVVFGYAESIGYDKGNKRLCHQAARAAARQLIHRAVRGA